jgi:hypothetical protein
LASKSSPTWKRSPPRRAGPHSGASRTSPCTSGWPRRTSRATASPAWRQRLGEAIEREKAEAGVFDRELFYGLQPLERLTAMVEQYRIALA